MPKATKKNPHPSRVMRCGAFIGEKKCRAARYKEGLCLRHYRMRNAPPCGLEHCQLPSYANVELTPAQAKDRTPAEQALITPERKLSLCESHYRRHHRESVRWDKPLNRAGAGDLVVVTTRIRPESKEKLVGELPKGKRLYAKLAEILESYAEGRLVEAAA